MKLLVAAIAIAFAATACVKQGQTTGPASRPAPALRDICTDVRFNSVCTPVQMPGAPVQVDTNTAGPRHANPPAFS